MSFALEELNSLKNPTWGNSIRGHLIKTERSNSFIKRSSSPEGFPKALTKNFHNDQLAKKNEHSTNASQ